MSIQESKIYKFRGGVWIGAWATSWPFCILEVAHNFLAIHDEMLKRDLSFSKDEIVQIEIKKYIPVIGYGIKIKHTKKNYDSIVYFWYVSFRFNKLSNALTELGWINVKSKQ